MQLIIGDCVEEMKKLDADSIDAIVTDPPYGLEFMGKEWDKLDTRQPGDPTLHKSGAGPYDRAKVRHSNAPSYGGVVSPQMQEWHYRWAIEAFRVAKPGAHLVAFGGTRTFHRLTCALEDAGWEIRDCLMWLYGSGFPKSHNVSKGIDKAAGVKRNVVGMIKGKGGENLNQLVRDGNDSEDARGCGAYGQGAKQITIDIPLTVPTTDEAKQWDGWGTALKPAWEPIILARKPLIGTVVKNVLEHGTGALNIDGTRIGVAVLPEIIAGKARLGTFERSNMVTPERIGRWPANVILDEDAAALLDEQSGETRSPLGPVQQGGHHRHDVGLSGSSRRGLGVGYADTGGASRFFYCAKASRSERGEENNHPTVKPVALMRWLCKLITPPKGIILDPFLGSGTTGMAAALENFEFVGIDKEDEYVQLAQLRIDKCVNPNASKFFE